MLSATSLTRRTDLEFLHRRLLWYVNLDSHFLLLPHFNSRCLYDEKICFRVYLGIPAYNFVNASSMKVRCSNKIGQSKKSQKPALSRNWNLGILDSGLPPKPNPKSNILVPYKDIRLPQRNDNLLSSSPISSLDASPTQSDHVSVSLDHSLSTCKSPKVEYMVDATISLPEYAESSETDLGNDDMIVNIDSNLVDPQLCGAFASDIYEHLRSLEVGLLYFFSSQIQFSH